MMVDILIFVSAYISSNAWITSSHIKINKDYVINNFIKLITLSLSRYKLSNRYAPKSITKYFGCTV